MPIINVNWTEQKSESEIREFIEVVADCVTRTVKAPTELVNVLVHEVPLDHVRFPAAILRIEWAANENRNQEAKAKIVDEITEYILKTTDIAPEKVVFFFHDMPKGHVGVAGKCK